MDDFQEISANRTVVRKNQKRIFLTPKCPLKYSYQLQDSFKPIYECPFIGKIHIPDITSPPSSCSPLVLDLFS